MTEYGSQTQNLCTISPRSTENMTLAYKNLADNSDSIHYLLSDSDYPSLKQERVSASTSWSPKLKNKCMPFGMV